MQRMILYPLMALVMLTITATCCAQNIFWLQGSWQGKAYLPGSDALQYYELSLKIYSIKGNKFEGVISTLESSDTSVRFDSRISGIVYDKYLIINKNKILYVKDAKDTRWKVSCNNCKPPRMVFSIENGKFFFRGEVKDCFKECNGISEFSKDITEFDSAGKETVYALINGVQKPEPVATSLGQNTNALSTDNTASLSQENESITERIPVLAAGTIAIAEHKTDSHLVQNVPGSLNKTLSITMKESEPIAQRIHILPAGAIVLAEHKTDLHLTQNVPGSLNKTLSMTMQESEPITQRIPVLSAGTIALTKHNNTALVLPQKLPVFLKHKAPSIIIKKNTFVITRTSLLPAGNIVVTKRNTASRLSQKPPHLLPNKNLFLIIKENAPPLVKNKIPSSVDTISSFGSNNNNALSEKASPALIHDTVASLPVGYAERKKNVIRTLMVNTDSIVLRVYDNGVVDGDIVSVIYNDEVVVDKLSLTARALVIKIPVNREGINTLVFHAHNLGDYPPNTAKLEIIYGNKKEEITVSSDFTVSSTIDIVHKEK